MVVDLGIAMLLFGAAGLFGQLQDALNTIWEVEPKPGRGVWGFIKDRFLSFSMVLGVAFLLLVSLVVSAALAALAGLFGDLADDERFTAPYRATLASLHDRGARATLEALVDVPQPAS